MIVADKSTVITVTTSVLQKMLCEKDWVLINRLDCKIKNKQLIVQNWKYLYAPYAVFDTWMGILVQENPYAVRFSKPTGA